LLSILPPEQGQRNCTPKVLNIQSTDLWSIRIDKEVPNRYPLLQPDQAPGHKCATTSVWEWFASARAGSVRLPETSGVRFSAYASHRGIRCFAVGGHDAGGVPQCFNVLISRGLGWRHLYCNRVQCAHISRQHQHRRTKGLSGRHADISLLAGHMRDRQIIMIAGRQAGRQAGQTRQADGRFVCMLARMLVPGLQPMLAACRTSPTTK
jgi:hypothetical protein